MFAAIDADGNENITKAEVKKYMLSAEGASLLEHFNSSREGITHMWSQLDGNHDGEVSKEEWVSAFLSALLPSKVCILPHETRIPRHQMKVISPDHFLMLDRLQGSCSPGHRSSVQ